MVTVPKVIIKVLRPVLVTFGIVIWVHCTVIWLIRFGWLGLFLEGNRDDSTRDVTAGAPTDNLENLNWYMVRVSLCGTRTW